METVLLGYFSPGPMELIIIGGIALLLFGKRLPEVARSLGKGIVEFKKGVRGIEDEVDSAVYSNSTTSSRPLPDDEDEELTAPKFEPPKYEPSDARDEDADVHDEDGEQQDESHSDQ